MTPQRIIWHHSAINAERNQLAEIERYHASRDFPLSKRNLHVGYHYLIERTGEVIQCREEHEIGAHDTGENLNSIGICLAGDFTAMLPNEAQAAAAAKLVADIRTRWDIPIARIEPHRWDDSTECPGEFVPDNWLTKEYLKRERGWLIKLFYLIGVQLRLL